MNHSEVARELAEAINQNCKDWVTRQQYACMVEHDAGLMLPILTKRFALQPVAMEAVVEKLAILTSNLGDQDAAIAVHAVERRKEIIRAELAPVETLLREYREDLMRENNLSPSKALLDSISQIDTIIGGQHGTRE